MTDYELTTRILSVEQRDQQTIVVLDDTIFHPQGGGQPADTGTIRSEQGCLHVTHVKRREDGAIEHAGQILEGSLQVGETVSCAIDQEKRILYTRLHSAGHLIDVALEQLNIHWKPGKGYHFPDGPYVEYQTEEVPDTNLAERLEGILQELISQDIPTEVNLSAPQRVVTLGHKAIPCGGTHVNSLAELGTITIRGIKHKGDTVKIRYALP